jgi:metal-sulfur cluster biosynthetic enzyme
MTATGQREAEVRARLGRVTDPELDEPVTALGFITGVAVDAAGGVTIGFRLPTYWCAANFAFMMADDMRREVAALPWVSRVAVELGEHMYADRINRGIAAGLSFQGTFESEAAGDLDALRRTFLIKAFQRRQEALLRHLLAAGHRPEDVVALTMAALGALPLSSDGEGLRQRYQERRDVAGAGDGDRPAFVDADGKVLSAADLPAYLRDVSRVGISAEFNGALCRGLLAARFGDVPPAAEPTVRDFLRAAPREGPHTAA